MTGHGQFYLCKHCGNLIGMILNSGVPMVCCGEKMERLAPNTVDASAEKHVPSVTVGENRVLVQVGSVPHPMSEEHHISWVYLETEHGGQRKDLAVDGEPAATFSLSGDKPVAVYAYCNLHGLWKAELS